MAAFGWSGRGRGLHPVGPRRDDQPVQVLQAPAGLHELDGQPVEQFGMGRGLAVEAEVEDRLDQRRAEVPHPDVIDRDPGRQRVVRIGDPARARASRRPVLVAGRTGVSGA